MRRRRPVDGEVEQRHTGYTDASFEHVDAPSFVEVELFLDIIQQVQYVSVVVRDQRVVHRRDVVIAPRRLTESVILIRNSIVLQWAVEGFYRGKDGLVKLP